MHNLNRGILVPVFFLVFALSSSDAYPQPAEWIIFDASNSELPDARFARSTVDKNGWVWVSARSSTISGVVVFDGVSWNLFDESNAPFSAGDGTSILASDSLGSVWIGTCNDPYGGGLLRFDGANWTEFTKFNSDLPEHCITHLAVDQLGNVWVAGVDPKLYNEGYLAQYDGAHFTVHFTDDLTGDEFGGLLWVSAMAAGPDSSLWVYRSIYHPLPEGFAVELARYQAGAWSFDGDIPFQNNSFVFDLVVDETSQVWIATQSQGLYAFDDTTWTSYNASNSPLPSDSVRVLAIEDGDILWIGTSNGLARLERGQWTIYNTSNSELPANHITGIVIDLEGNKWISTIDEERNISGGSIAVFRAEGVVGVNVEAQDELPAGYDGLRNYPNPFTSVTTITYSLSVSQHVALRVFDMLGREVAVLRDGWGSSGNHEVVFDARGLASGVYVVQFRAGEQIQTRPMISFK